MVPEFFEKYSVMSSRCRHPYYKENLLNKNTKKEKWDFNLTICYIKTRLHQLWVNNYIKSIRIALHIFQLMLHINYFEQNMRKLGHTGRMTPFSYIGQRLYRIFLYVECRYRYDSVTIINFLYMLLLMLLLMFIGCFHTYEMMIFKISFRYAVLYRIVYNIQVKNIIILFYNYIQSTFKICFMVKM